jgi:hypothetical protein
MLGLPYHANTNGSVRPSALAAWPVAEESAVWKVTRGAAPEAGAMSSRRPVHQYQPRSPQYPVASFLKINDENDAEEAVSDHVARIDQQGFEIERSALRGFYRLLVSLQTDQYESFSSLLYWSCSIKELSEREVICSNVLIVPKLGQHTFTEIEAVARRLLQRMRGAHPETRQIFNVVAHVSPL